MASTSGSERDSEEQWDDMAIVRAFEEALTDQRARGPAASSGRAAGRRKHKVASRSNSKKAARIVSIAEGDEEEEEEEEEDQHDGHGYAAASAAAGVGMYGQPNAAAYGGYPAYQQQQQQGHQQQQASTDLYQAAYAQAYAQLQAQFQAAYPGAAAAAPPPQPYGTAAQMPVFAAQPPYYPSAGSAVPPAPPMPFPGMPGAPFPPSAAGSDDGLANVLMAWYQSGYYTGRFQAMQEMRMRGQR